MASVTTNVGRIQQDFMNNVMQQNQQNCLLQTVNAANNNIVIVNGGTIAGNVIGVSLATTTDATCLIISSMESTIDNTLSAILKQQNQASTDWFNGGQFSAQTNIFDLDQSITNNISQINEATCDATTVNSTNNNYVYMQNLVVGGDYIGVLNTANTTANCSLTNTMKNTTYNQAQASATQSNTEIGMFVAIFAAIAAIVGLIIFGTVIYFATGAFNHVGYNKPPSQLTPEQQELQAARELGITPEELQILAGLPVA